MTTGSGWYRTNVYAQINQTRTAATWQQGIAIAQQNADIQVRASWSVVAAGGALSAVALVARRTDNNNYYRASLRENVDHSMDLLLVKVVAGVSTTVQIVSIPGTYAANDWWFIRFQLEDTHLRAKAWKLTALGVADQPAWQIDTTDSSITTSTGNISIRSSNSGSTARPIVSFSDFRIQTVGLTIHFFMRMNKTSFNTPAGGGQYVVLLSKEDNGQAEWHFRLYSANASNDHAGWLSFYAFNLEGKLGNGAAYWQPGDGATPLPAMDSNTWYQFVGVMDPGDFRDWQAGVRLYKDGALVPIPPMSAGEKYENHDSSGNTWHIDPKNGSAPVRMGSVTASTDFQCTLDEVAIFARRLTADKIKSLWDARFQ